MWLNYWFSSALLTGAYKHGLRLIDMLRITEKVSDEQVVIGSLLGSSRVFIVRLVYVVKHTGHPHPSQSYGALFSCDCDGFAGAGRYVEEKRTVTC